MRGLKLTRRGEAVRDALLFIGALGGVYAAILAMVVAFDALMGVA